MPSDDKSSLCLWQGELIISGSVGHLGFLFQLNTWVNSIKPEPQEKTNGGCFSPVKYLHRMSMTQQHIEHVDIK